MSFLTACLNNLPCSRSRTRSSDKLLTLIGNFVRESVLRKQKELEEFYVPELFSIARLNQHCEKKEVAIELLFDYYSQLKKSPALILADLKMRLNNPELFLLSLATLVQHQ